VDLYNPTQIWEYHKFENFAKHKLASWLVDSFENFHYDYAVQI